MSKTISFKVSDNGKIINVAYDENMTCENFVLDFTKKNTNLSTIDTNVYTFKAGDRLVQGIFMKYLTTDSDLNLELERTSDK